MQIKRANTSRGISLEKLAKKEAMSQPQDDAAMQAELDALLGADVLGTEPAGEEGADADLEAQQIVEADEQAEEQEVDAELPAAATQANIANITPTQPDDEPTVPAAAAPPTQPSAAAPEAEEEGVVQPPAPAAPAPAKDSSGSGDKKRPNFAKPAAPKKPLLVAKAAPVVKSAPAAKPTAAAKPAAPAPSTAPTTKAPAVKKPAPSAAAPATTKPTPSAAAPATTKPPPKKKLTARAAPPEDEDEAAATAAPAPAGAGPAPTKKPAAKPPKPAPAKPAETARGGSDQPQAQQKKKASGGGKKKVANEGGEEKEKGPKRPTSSYFYFCAAKRPELKMAEPGLGPKELVTRLGELFRALSEEEKAPFLALGAADKERYEREKAEMVATAGSGAGPSTKPAPKARLPKAPKAATVAAAAADDGEDAASAEAEGEEPALHQAPAAAPKRKLADKRGGGGTRKKARRAEQQQLDREVAAMAEAAEESDREAEEQERLNCDWEAHPAEYILGATRTGKYLVDITAAKAARAGASSSAPPCPVTAAMLEEYEGWQTAWARSVHGCTESSSGVTELCLEDLPEGSPLESLAFLGDCRNPGYGLDKPTEKGDVRMSVPMMGVCKLVQRMLVHERLRTAAVLARAETAEALLAAAMGAAVGEEEAAQEVAGAEEGEGEYEEGAEGQEEQENMAAVEEEEAGADADADAGNRGKENAAGPTPGTKKKLSMEV